MIMDSSGGIFGPEAQMTQPTCGGAVTAVWQTLCKLCRHLLRTHWMAGNAPHKIGRCQDRSDYHTQTSLDCDICHRQIQVRTQISIRCCRIEHWVHLRCTGIRLVQYINTTHNTATNTQTHIPLSPCSPNTYPPLPEPNTCHTLHLHLSPHSALARYLH